MEGRVLPPPQVGPGGEGTRRAEPKAGFQEGTPPRSGSELRVPPPPLRSSLGKPFPPGGFGLGSPGEGRGEVCSGASSDPTPLQALRPLSAMASKRIQKELAVRCLVYMSLLCVSVYMCVSYCVMCDMCVSPSERWLVCLCGVVWLLCVDRLWFCAWCLGFALGRFGGDLRLR